MNLYTICIGIYHKMNIREKRILSEIKKIELHNNSNTDGIYIYSHEEDMNKFTALIIGPENSVYEGGFFLFTILLPADYPFQPPKFTFITPEYSDIGRIHPNLYKDGKVCLSILNTWGDNEWSSGLKLLPICNTIQSILDDNPISHEPPYTDRIDNNYKIVAKYKSLQAVSDIYKCRDKFPSMISNKIQEIYSKNKDIYVKKGLEFSNMINKNIKYFHGNITIHELEFN